MEEQSMEYEGAPEMSTPENAGPEPQGVPGAQEPTTEQSGFAPEVTGGQVSFSRGFAGVVAAQGDATLSKAGAMALAAGKDMNVEMGGGTLMMAGGNLNLTNGGSQVMVVGGNVDVTNGGAQVLLAGGNATLNKGFVGILLAQKAELGEGTKVLLNTRQALVFGLALGAVVGLFRLLFGPRK